MEASFSAVDSLESDDRRLLERIARATEARLRNIAPINNGSTFLTARAQHISTQRLVFLTIARPHDGDARSQLSAVRDMMVAVNDERVGVLIDQLWDSDNRDEGWACLASTWHDGLEPLDTALMGRSSPDSPRTHVFKDLRELCIQLQKLHLHGFAHGDVSMQNVGIDGSGRVHLIDFEHVVSSGNLDRSKVALTPGYSHPDKLPLGGPQGATLVARQLWDCYGVGRIFLDVLAYLSPHSSPELTPRNQRAIRLIGCLLLDGRNEATELAMGLPSSFFVAERFTDISQAISALDRLLGRARIEDAVPELRPTVTSVVEIGSFRPVPFTSRVEALLNDPYMRYLGEFYQLGLICYIWPTATHTRREHALGTFGLAVSVVESLLADPENPLVQVIMTPARVRCALLAALLHDVGHYPLAHDLEEAHPIAFDHERRSIAIITGGTLSEVLARSEHLGGWEVLPTDVASIINGYPLEGASLGEHLCALLHSIISGPVDADKLDYLRRDSEHLNVAAGQGLDIARLVRSLTVATVPLSVGDSTVTLRMAVRSKARRPAELVGRIRSHMFGVAYWHHSYRSIKAMIQWIVWSAFDDSRVRTTRPAAQRLARDLYKELDTRILGAEGAISNGGEGSTRAPALFSLAAVDSSDRGALPPAEAQVLAWLVERGEASASGFWQLLSNQRWFRSVLTVEHYSNETAIADPETSDSVFQIWEHLGRIYALPADSRPKARMALARLVQQGVCDWLQPLSEGEGPTIVYDFNEWQTRMLAAASTQQLFLVDGPDPDRAFQKPLYYSVGERRGSSTVDAALSIPIVRSFDEQQLSGQFVASNGAIRLLCHPDFEKFVEASVNRSTLRNILLHAMEETLKP